MCAVCLSSDISVDRRDCRLFRRALETAEQPYWKTESSHDLSAPEKFTFGTTSRKLAYSAQMYHYEQQKRRIIEEEKCVLRSAIPSYQLCSGKNGPAAKRGKMS